ncbi:MAG: DUF1540 domain-containing protein [Propioniciclava sp.]|uniref:DUF1540 domain-containing protein n=1 Tax=Propioniciclava sp. TaxID=2038686 RepID=UPI0039E56FFD
MTELRELPTVSECSVAGCSYNDHTHCKAPAITVGQQASCVTFIPLATIRGGMDKVVSHIGACQRAECTHNSHLECTAASVMIGSAADKADCLTYSPR